MLRQRPYEPNSYRDLARALEDAGRYPLAALLNEAVLAGAWHDRFRDSLRVVTREEYARIQKILGRDPNITELGIFSVMWSEHCSYK